MDFLDEFNSTFQPDFPELKIAILSSSIDPEDVVKSKSYSNVIGFLPKPFNMETVDRLKKFDELARYFVA